MSDDLIERPWRCDVTGNPVGTDTRMIGAPPCDCQGCRAADTLAAKDTAISEMRAELERHQDEEDKAAREMQTVIQGLRDRATAAEATLATVNHVLEAASDREKGLYDRIETMLARATAAEAQLEAVKADCEYWSSETARVCGEASALRKALTPFAKIAAAVFYVDNDGREMNSHRADDLAVWGFDRVELTYGHLRAARALSQDEPADLGVGG